MDNGVHGAHATPTLGVTVCIFLAFPKPHLNRVKCLLWINFQINLNYDQIIPIT